MSSNPTATIRPARRDDLDQLEEFIQPFVAEKTILPRTTDELAELIEHGFVADEDGRLVGFGALEIYSPKLAEIRSLVVSADHRGRGIGRRLVEACVQRACERNVLEVMVITSREDLFKSCGFDFTLPRERKALFLQTRDE